MSAGVAIHFLSQEKKAFSCDQKCLKVYGARLRRTTAIVLYLHNDYLFITTIALKFKGEGRQDEHLNSHY